MAQSEADLALLSATRPPRRWNRGVAIRFVLAITPTVAFAIMGAIEQHLQTH